MGAPLLAFRAGSKAGLAKTGFSQRLFKVLPPALRLDGERVGKVLIGVPGLE